VSLVAIYARYSSDLQRAASIEDQIRLCQKRVACEGWTTFKCYTDQAMSGASLMRPGIQLLIQDALAGRFHVVLAESLDRLSRDLENIAGLYKRLAFAGVQIVTLSDGVISDMHVGLKGTMAALFLKDPADKTRRGIRGRIEAGKSGGGNSYGYKVVRQFGPSGEPIRGDRRLILHRRQSCGGFSPNIHKACPPGRSRCG
jgi:site-specific DNA recombinase